MSAPVSPALVDDVVDGRYHVRELIAEGGMATVYLATDTRLDRDVALKVMQPHLARDEEFVTRFRREARSAARLSHPNVVSVHDQGEDGGRVFLTMEYVPGRTLRQVMSDVGPLDPRAALDTLESMLMALDAAHRAGLMHRDVKPENVIIREDGVVKVADFGLARLVGSHTTTADADVILGTVAYLSPEQVERGHADARSDVYAAGLVLLEMLTDRKAFTGDTPIQVAYQHVHGSVPTPSDLLPSVPPACDALVAHATARDPEQRPPDASAFLGELRAARATLAGAPEHGDAPRAPREGAPPSSDHTAVVPVAPPHSPPTDQTSVLRAPTSTRSGTRATAGRGGSEGHWGLARLVVPLVLLLATGFAAWWFIAGPGGPTTVPQVSGLTYQDAAARLDDAHLEAVREDVFSEDVPKGTVIDSEPGKGADLGRGSSVTVNVSKGPQRFAVPDLAGTDLDAARAAITDAQLTVGEVTEVYDASTPAGVVLTADPGAGTELKRGAPVALTVSNGPQPLTVPSVVGLPYKTAEKTLSDLGLLVERGEKVFSSTVPKGTVARQTPSSGSLFPGDTVTLSVSKGTEKVKVPDVVGLKTGEAKKALQDAGFGVDVRKILGGPSDTVRSQHPGAGRKFPTGTTVVLVIF